MTSSNSAKGVKSVWRMDRVNATTAPPTPNSKGATVLRPEDLELDPLYGDAANPGQCVSAGPTPAMKRRITTAKWCAVSTTNRWSPHSLTAAVRPSPSAHHHQPLVEGDADFNQPDNLAFSRTGNTYVIEDHPNATSGPAARRYGPRHQERRLRENPVGARQLGRTDRFLLRAGRKTAYVNISTRTTATCPLLDDYGTDDLIKITGFKVKKERD